MLEAFIYALFNMIRGKSFIELEFPSAGPGHVLWRNLRRRVNLFVGIGAHEPAQQRLASSFAVGPCGIEKIATQIDGPLQRTKRLFVIGAAPTSHAPHPAADFTHEPVSAAKATIVHDCFVLTLFRLLICYPTPLGYRGSRTSPTIDCHRDNDKRANNDLLNIVGPTNLLATVAEKSHDQCADHRTKDAAFPATQASAP